MAYEIQDHLVSGGSAEVYKAYDTQLERPVALKFLHASDPRHLAAMLREARSQAHVRHPNVCQVFEVSEVDGKPCIVMQLVDGKPLHQAAREMTVREKITAVRAIAGAVHAAHAEGLIHRDLKPSNVIVEKRAGGGWHPYVLDFGLAFERDDPGSTITGTFKGTPHYMAPEQAAGRQGLDHRADVYGLGAILYEVLCGRPPFDGQNPVEVLVQVLRKEPTPLRRRAPALSSDLELIAAKCLEKEPDRRYDSARSLAEDLDRFLAGEAVLAQRPSRIYRLHKRLARNKALTVVSAAALVAVLALSATALRVRWRSAERAEIAQAFGHEVRDIEWLMRVVYMQPLHDIRAERDHVRRRMERLEASMDAAGPLAAGPGHYALGSAHLALGEWQGARRHLDHAWERGYRTRGVASALGRAYGGLYQQALDQAQRVSPGALHDALTGTAERELRDPALRYLRESTPAGAAEAGDDDRLGIAPEYVLGLIAFYENRYEVAIEKAASAHRAAGWLYEAVVLRGEVLLELASERFRAADPDGARQAAGEAAAVFRQALEIAASHPRAAAGECTSYFLEIEVERLQGRHSPELIAAGREACDRAIAADPESDTGHRPRALFLTAVAEVAYERGGDPRPHVEEATASATRAVEAAGDDSVTLSLLGRSYGLRARFERDHGGDAAPWFERANEMHRQAIARWPNYAYALRNLATNLVEQADHEAQRGRDPRRLLAEAVDLFASVLEENPGSASTLNALGNAYWSLAESELDAGGDPDKPSRQAIDVFTRARRVVDAPVFAYGIASVHLLRAEVLLDNAGQAGDELAAARAALEVAEAPPYFRLPRARLGLLTGRWQAGLGRSPEETFDSTRRELEGILAAGVDEPELELTLAEVCRRHAAWRLARGRPATALIAAGLETAAQALDRDPELAAALAIRGALHLLAAEAADSASIRRARAGEALAALDAAYRINPIGKEPWRVLRARAEELRQGG